MSAQTAKHTILQLPLVPPQERLTLNLLPDPVVPEPKSILATSRSSPSLVRRSRPVLQGSHFTYLSPFPLSFPYEFPSEEVHDAAQADDSLGQQHQRQMEEEKEQEHQLSPQQQAEKEEQAHKKRMDEIERIMRRYEVQPSSLAGGQPPSPHVGLGSFVPPGRQSQHFPSARLLALSPAALEQCLPHLDVGDALEWIRSQDGKQGPESYSSGPMVPLPTSPAARARYELSDFLSGRLVGADLTKTGGGDGKDLEQDPRAGTGTEYLAIKEATQKGELPEESTQESVVRRLKELEERRGRLHEVGYAPWALCYAGHQFGTWAGQLGDGRAVTLMETRNPDTSERWDIQLKGAGRTPYSRFADGLATLGSSVREFLGSEAMGALGIPTSRALAVVSLPDLQVVRERANPAAITTRLCPSWLRIGSFQIHSSRSEWESCRVLGEYVSHDLFGWHDVVKGGLPASANGTADRPAWARRLVDEVARRNAITIARWQVYGFMHGVMNTDNIALLGHTIDYGPYAFMDVFDEGQICNHSDGEGRYAFRLQPTMGVFVIRELLKALAPVVGFELRHGRAPAPGELVRLASDEIEELAKLADERAAAEVEQAFTSTVLDEWRRGWSARLGLRDVATGEESTARLVDPLLGVLADLDFPSTLRSLCRLPTFLKHRALAGCDVHDEAAVQAAVRAFVADGGWYDEGVVPEYLRSAKRDQAVAWLGTYARRLVHEGRDGETVTREMERVNPRFVLRNWVTGEVVQRLEESNDTRFLERVLQMCLHPFEAWGTEREGRDEGDVREEARLCSVGRPLTVNLPSCSS